MGRLQTTILIGLVRLLAAVALSCSSSTAPDDRAGGDGAGGEDRPSGGDGGGGNACEAVGGMCSGTTCPPGYHADPGELTLGNVCNPCPPGAPCAQFPCCLPDATDGGTDAPGDVGQSDGSDVGAPPDRMPISCGSMTCGADEICVVQCTCCGVPTDMAPSADYRCEPIPPGCVGDADPCMCGQIHCDFSSSGSCPGDQRMLECPCA
jgi:hypothetical protein